MSTFYSLIMANTNRTIEEKASMRKEEVANRPAKIKQLRDTLNTTRQFVKDSFAKQASSASAEPTDSTQTSTKANLIPVADLFFDAEALEELSKLSDTIEAWLHNALEEQDQLKQDDDPYFRTSEVDKKAKQLESGLLKVLMAKPPKTKATSSTASSVASSTLPTSSIVADFTTISETAIPSSRESSDPHDEL